MELIDTHTHLDSADYAGQVDQVLSRAHHVGVSRCITIGTSLQDSQAAVALASQHDSLFCTVGIHPHEAEKTEPGYIDVLTTLLAANDSVCALGEIGLDYYYDFAKRTAQQRRFQEQLELAGKLGKPVVIHCRDAFDDCLAILNDFDVAAHGFVFHCFSGDRPWARAVLDRGGSLSFTGTITFKRSEAVQQAAQYAPWPSLLIETDCPYLSPVPKRHVKPNEPALVVHVAAKLAELRNSSLDDTAGITTENAVRFFNLPANRTLDQQTP